MARSLISLWLLVLLSFPACFNTCALDFNEGVGLPCEDDDACPEGTYCASDKTCQTGSAQDAASGDAAQVEDASGLDASSSDAATVDARQLDASVADLVLADTSLVDAAAVDTAALDATGLDSAVLDVALVGDSGVEDGAGADAALEDAAGEDSSITADATAMDVTAVDAAAADIAAPDTNIEDAGAEDAGSEDAGTEDAGTEDAGEEDGGACPAPGYTIVPDIGVAISATTPLTITFDQPMEIGSLSSSGSMASAAAAPVWNGDTEVSLVPTLDWPAGSQTLTVEVMSQCGQVATIAAGYLVKHVQPLYPTSGADWNDYVVNDGSDWISATDAACGGDETGGVDACLHGGELRLLEVPNASDCTNLSATDALGAFEWICLENAGGGAPFFASVGLAATASASRLVDFGSTEWRTNSVTVEESASTLYQTDPEVWWGNQVRSFVSSVSMVEGGVYLIADDTDQHLSPNHDKIAVLIADGATLSFQPGTGSQSVAWPGGRSFLWFEGDLDATNDMYGVHLVDVTFSVLRQMTIIKGTTGLKLTRSHRNRLIDVRLDGELQSGIYLDESDQNSLQRVSVSGDGGGTCITVYNSDGNAFDGARAANCQTGLSLSSAQDNVLADVHVSNCETAGYRIYNGSARNTVVGLTVDSSGDGVRLDGDGAEDNILACVTSANCEAGIRFGSTIAEQHNNLLFGAAVVNVDGVAFQTNGDMFDTEVIHLAAAEGQGSAAYLSSATPTYFHGELKVGLGCHTFSEDRGLFGDCSPGAGSTANLTTGVSMAGTFLAKVTSDDAVNQSDTDGAVGYADFIDWLGFEEPLRGWGRDGAGAFPALDQTDRCIGSETCRIYDWRLTDDDTGDANDPVALDALLESDTDVITHTWSDASTSTFVINAVEELFDGVGNDNGLCESDEVCLYTPNLGAYQGHGARVSATFTPGSVSGVTLYKYEHNGIAP